MPGDVVRGKAEEPAADPIHSRNQVKQRRLARSVGPDQAVHAAAPHRKVNGINGQEAAEAPRHGVHLQQPLAMRGGAHGAAFRDAVGLRMSRIANACKRRPKVAASAASPPSPNSMVAMSIAPKTSIR